MARKLKENRPLERPKHKWENNIKNDLKQKQGCQDVDKTHPAQITI
jgi:hypothetical protein